MSETQLTLTRGFDVHIDEEGLALRGTFIVNPEGIIKTCEIHSNEIARDVSETIRKLEAAQFTATHDGEVCPIFPLANNHLVFLIGVFLL